MSNSSYLDLPATRMLATHCCVCGRPLADARSVELGIGPDCRDGYEGDVSEAQREVCNKLTHAAALYCQQGRIDRVRECAAAIRAVGLLGLARAIEQRFVNAKPRIVISEVPGVPFYSVKTPFLRSRAGEMVGAWRALPSRRWNAATRTNLVSKERKAELWSLLRRFYAGEYGTGPDGKLFRVPS